jgi:hypothetical protein
MQKKQAANATRPSIAMRCKTASAGKRLGKVDYPVGTVKNRAIDRNARVFANRLVIARFIGGASSDCFDPHYYR